MHESVVLKICQIGIVIKDFVEIQDLELNSRREVTKLVQEYEWTTEKCIFNKISVPFT